MTARRKAAGSGAKAGKSRTGGRSSTARKKAARAAHQRKRQVFFFGNGKAQAPARMREILEAHHNPSEEWENAETVAWQIPPPPPALPEAWVLDVASLKDAALGQDLEPVGAVAMAEALVGADIIPHREDGMAPHIDPYGPFGPKEFSLRTSVKHLDFY